MRNSVGVPPVSSAGTTNLVTVTVTDTGTLLSATNSFNVIVNPLSSQPTVEFDWHIRRAGDIGIERAARTGLHGFDYDESDRPPVRLAGADDDQFAGNAGDIDGAHYRRSSALLQHPNRAMILAGLVIRRRDA